MFCRIWNLVLAATATDRWDSEMDLLYNGLKKKNCVCSCFSLGLFRLRCLQSDLCEFRTGHKRVCRKPIAHDETDFMCIFRIINYGSIKFGFNDLNTSSLGGIFIH